MVFKLKMHCITGTARAINANHLLATAVLDFAEPMPINALFLMGGTVVAELIEGIALMKNRSQRHPFLVDVDRQVILFEAQHRWLYAFSSVAAHCDTLRMEFRLRKIRSSLLPLNGRGWLWSDVVGYAVNTSNLADDARRNAG